MRGTKYGRPKIPLPLDFDIVYHLKTEDVMSLREYNQLYDGVRKHIFGENYEHAQIIYAKKSEEK